MLQVWPVPHTEILPLAELTETTKVREVGKTLVVDLPGRADAFATRGGHKIDGTKAYVLHLRAAIASMTPPTMVLWPLAPGMDFRKTPAMERPLPADFSSRSHDYYFTIGPTGNEIDIIVLSLATPGTLSIESLRLERMTPVTRLLCYWQDFRGFRNQPPNFMILMAAGLVLLVVRPAMAILRLAFTRRFSERRTLVHAVLVGVIALWCIQGVRAVAVHWGELLRNIEMFFELPAKNRNVSGIGTPWHQMAELVDKVVPPDEPVTIAPTTMSIRGWRLAMAIAPRPFASASCGQAEVYTRYLAAMPDCMKLPDGFTKVAEGPMGQIVACRSDTPVQAFRPLLSDEERPAGPLELPRLVLTILLVIAVGEAVVRMLFLGREGPKGAIRLGLLWCVGIGVVTILMHVFTIIGLPYWPASIAACALLIAAGVRIGRRRSDEIPSRPAGPFAPDERVLLAVLLGLWALAILGCLWNPMEEWDEIVNWGYRAHVFYHAGPTIQTVRDYALASPRHKAYPIGLPLSEAFVCLGMGRWDEAHAKFPSALYYFAMILLVYGAVRPAAGRRMALLAAALSGSGAMALRMASVGMADLPLGVLFFAAMLCLDRYDGEPGWLFTAGFLGALMSWMKLDGGALKLLLLAMATLKVGATGVSRRKLGQLGLAVLLAFVPVAAWSYVYRAVGLSDWVLGAPAAVKGHVRLLPAIAEATGQYLLTASWENGPIFNATYVFLAAVLLGAPTLLLRRGAWLWTLGLLCGVVGYAFIYVVSPQGLYQMARSLDRILFHFYPLAVALSGRALGAHYESRLPRTGSSRP